MKIAILSSGPSVLDQWEARSGEGWDVTIGISTTCWHIDVDWMCWMDGRAIAGMIERKRQPKKGLVWHTNDLSFGWNVKHEKYPNFSNGRRAPFTLPNALNWAFLKWPRASIEILGHDGTERPNIGGMNTNHGYPRWEEERMWMELALSDEKARQGKTCKYSKSSV